MRRWLSISLILFFWLGPLATLLPASDESRLPLCCRREGAHHCKGTMNVAQVESSHSILTAPAHCPFFPNFIARTTTPNHALTISSVRAPMLLAGAYTPVANYIAAYLAPIRTRAIRGPPANIPG
jgi:hypothetical protein